jgi:alpha-1,2-mannosyltransferase
MSQDGTLVAPTAEGGGGLARRFRLGWLTPTRTTVLLVVVLTTWMLVWAAYTVSTSAAGDFYAYYLAADAVENGRSPYAPAEMQRRAVELGLTRHRVSVTYRYPPLTALALRPFLGSDAERLAFAWLVLNGVALITAAAMCGLALGGGWRVPAALGLLLTSFPAVDSLLCGQIDGLLFACMAGGLLALKRGHGVTSGGLLALGAMIKVTPIVLIAYLGWRRSWTAFASALIALVTLGLFSVWSGGTNLAADFLRSAWRLGTAQVSLFTPANPTIVGTLGKFLGEEVTTNGGARPTLAIGLALGLLLGAATAYLCRPGGDRRRWLDTEFALVVTALVLMPALSWYHQTVTLILPLLVVAESLVVRRRWGLLASLGVLYLCADLNQAIWYTFIETLSASQAWRLMVFPFALSLVLWIELARRLAAGRRAWPDPAVEAAPCDEPPRESAAAGGMRRPTSAG